MEGEVGILSVIGFQTQFASRGRMFDFQNDNFPDVPKAVMRTKVESRRAALQI